MVKLELFSLQEKVKSEYQQNLEHKAKVEELEVALNQLIYEKKILNDELESYKRISNSRVSDAQS